MIFNETDRAAIGGGIHTGFFGERLWLEKCTNACEGVARVEGISNPHLIKCGKPAKFLYFWRQWLSEVMRESSDPIYSNVGAKCCEECFSKIIKNSGPPSDLEDLREKWARNKEKTRAMDDELLKQNHE